MTNIIEEIQKTLIKNSSPLSPTHTPLSLWTDVIVGQQIIEPLMALKQDDPTLDINVTINWLAGLEKNIPSLNDVNDFAHKTKAEVELIQSDLFSSFQLISFEPNLITFNVPIMAGDYQDSTTATLTITPNSASLVHGEDRRLMTQYLPELEAISQSLYAKSLKALTFDEAAVVLPIAYTPVLALENSFGGFNPIDTTTTLLAVLSKNPNFKQQIPTKIYQALIDRFNSLPISSFHVQ